MIDVDIIDAHHHLQRVTSRSYPWLEGPPITRYHGDDTVLRRDYLTGDYRADFAGLPLVGSVHVENGAADPDDETDWIAAVHERDGLPSVHVARVDLLSAEAPARLERLADLPIVRGVRYMLNWHSEPFYRHIDRDDLMTDTVWLDNLGRLENLGLSFDLQVFPGQLAEAERVIRRFPGIGFVLDHAAMPIRRDADGIAYWRREIERLRPLDNVRVKVSALGTLDHSWSVASIRPFVRGVIELFGTERTMFGSNFPVDGMYSTLPELYEAFDELTADLSRDERRDLFAETARRAYRMTESGRA